MPASRLPFARLGLMTFEYTELAELQKPGPNMGQETATLALPRGARMREADSDGRPGVHRSARAPSQATTPFHPYLSGAGADSAFGSPALRNTCCAA